MKNFFIIIVLIILSGCSTNSDKAKQVDTMNGINDNSLDTTINPQPNGYAPPNTKIDTSQQRKDSIKARKQ